MQILSTTTSKSHARLGSVVECAALSLQPPKRYHMPQFLQQNHTTEKRMAINKETAIIVQQVKTEQYSFNQYIVTFKCYCQTGKQL